MKLPLPNCKWFKKTTKQQVTPRQYKAALKTLTEEEWYVTGLAAWSNAVWNLLSRKFPAMALEGAKFKEPQTPNDLIAQRDTDLYSSVRPSPWGIAANYPDAKAQGLKLDKLLQPNNDYQEVYHVLADIYWYVNYVKRNTELPVYFPEDAPMLHVIKESARKTPSVSWYDEPAVYMVFPPDYSVSGTLPSSKPGINMDGKALFGMMGMLVTVPELVLAYDEFCGDLNKLYSTKLHNNSSSIGIHTNGEHIEAMHAFLSDFLVEANSQNLDNMPIAFFAEAAQDGSCSSISTAGNLPMCLKLKDSDVKSTEGTALHSTVKAVQLFVQLFIGFKLYLDAFPESESAGVPPAWADKYKLQSSMTSKVAANAFPECAGDSGRVMSPHYRSGSFMTFVNDRYTKMKGKTIWRKGGFVKQAVDSATVDDVYPDVTVEAAGVLVT